MPTDLADTPADMAHLVGHALPGGQFRLDESENALLHEALYSHPRASPHPLAAFAATQRGMGMQVSELFKLLGAEMDDGPLLAACTLEFPGELRTETDYEVVAVINSIVRKQTRKLGAVDFVTCRMELREDNTNSLAAVVTNVYALQRSK